MILKVWLTPSQLASGNVKLPQRELLAPPLNNKNMQAVGTRFKAHDEVVHRMCVMVRVSKGNRHVVHPNTTRKLTLTSATVEMLVAAQLSLHQNQATGLNPIASVEWVSRAIVHRDRPQ